MSDDGLPSYADLLARTDGVPPGSAWGLWGPDDQLGTLNHLTPQRTVQAAHAVRTGDRFNLDLPEPAFAPALTPTRKPLRHHMFGVSPFHRDEWLDGFYTQVGSQIDGLRHFGHPDWGFYNGADPDRLVTGDPLLGISAFAEHGIVGRGVLVDVGRYLAARGEAIDHTTNHAIGIDVVDAAAAEHGVTPRPGDIVMIRTGWVAHHLGLDRAERARAVNPLRCPGLRQSHDTVAWLWDHRVALVATDTFAVEAWPAVGDSPFVTEAERTGRLARDRHTGLMHRVLIPLLGMPLGELWRLDELAEACASDGRYECLLVAKPLNIVGGVGSPANATAIR
ncbi:cyclase family protein [Gandjariella thermophila]|uniref:cyclase family protein n=1 Tax=Gandjariella thermophila TaxID=1931992 RepID=UPI001863FBD1|nr:cyclase family protein [Gandjariella thermophila]